MSPLCFLAFGKVFAAAIDRGPGRRLGHPDAEPAVSRYRTRAVAADAALLELDPQTGRMHQLRVHLAGIGRPIAGDARYGGALVVRGHAVPRLMLHAAALAFPHPAGGTKRIETPPPSDMAQLIEALGLR